MINTNNKFERIKNAQRMCHVAISVSMSKHKLSTLADPLGPRSPIYRECVTMIEEAFMLGGRLQLQVRMV